MTRDEIIDATLIKLDKVSPGRLMLGEYCMDTGLGDRYAFELRDALLAEDLARSLDPNTHMVITDRGRKILREGGWLKFCEREQLERERQLVREAIEEKKLHHDAFISEWQVKTRWWPHIISVISLIVAVTALVMQLWKSEATEEKSELPIPVEQAELSSSKVPTEVDQSLHPDTLK